VIERWIVAEAREGLGLAAEAWLTQDIERDAVVLILSREILRSYERLDYLSRRLADRGLDRVAEHVRRNLLPGPGNQRVGDFGELVATAVFRRLKQYTVPVLKLRFKLDPNESQRLIDVVAFQHLSRPGEVVLAVTEVKTRTNTPTPLPPTLGIDAYKQLLEAVDERMGQSLTFIRKRLEEQGRVWLADRVEALLDDETYTLERYLAFVVDEAAWRDVILERLDQHDRDAEHLCANVLLIGDLNSLVDDSYAAAQELEGVAIGP
jgi:hypothetical protein